MFSCVSPRMVGWCAGLAVCMGDHRLKRPVAEQVWQHVWVDPLCRKFCPCHVLVMLL